MFLKYQAARKALVNKLIRGDHSFLIRNNISTITDTVIPSLPGSPKLEPLVSSPVKHQGLPIHIDTDPGKECTDDDDNGSGGAYNTAFVIARNLKQQSKSL